MINKLSLLRYQNCQSIFNYACHIKILSFRKRRDTKIQQWTSYPPRIISASLQFWMARKISAEWIESCFRTFSHRDLSRSPFESSLYSKTNKISSTTGCKYFNYCALALDCNSNGSSDSVGALNPPKGIANYVNNIPRTFSINCRQYWRRHRGTIMALTLRSKQRN